jgi:hypothetical protein
VTDDAEQPQLVRDLGGFVGAAVAGLLLAGCALRLWMIAILSEAGFSASPSAAPWTALLYTAGAVLVGTAVLAVYWFATGQARRAVLLVAIAAAAGWLVPSMAS